LSPVYEPSIPDSDSLSFVRLIKLFIDFETIESAIKKQLHRIKYRASSITSTSWQFCQKADTILTAQLYLIWQGLFGKHGLCTYPDPHTAFCIQAARFAI